MYMPIPMNIPHILLLILLIVFAVGLSTSCSKDKESLSIPTPIVSPTDVLKDTQKSMSSVKSYKFRLSHRMGNGSKIDQSLTLVNAWGSVSRDNGISLESDLLFGNIPVSAGIVKTRDSTYLRDPLTQKWQVIPKGTNPFDFLDPDRMISSILEGVTEPDLLSDEDGFFKIEGKISTTSFDYIFQDTVNEQVDLTVWIDSGSFVIKRAEIVGKISETDPDKIIRVLEISRYNQVLEIVTPEIK